MNLVEWSRQNVNFLRADLLRMRISAFVPRVAVGNAHAYGSVSQEEGSV